MEVQIVPKKCPNYLQNTSKICSVTKRLLEIQSCDKCTSNGCQVLCAGANNGDAIHHTDEEHQEGIHSLHLDESKKRKKITCRQGCDSVKKLNLFKPLFKCCRKIFTQRKVLFLHMMRRLRNVCKPVYVCSICSAEFNLYLDLYHHSKNNHCRLDFPKLEYSCGRCFQPYRVFYSLQRHQMDENDCLPVKSYHRVSGFLDLRTEFEDYYSSKTNDDTIDNLPLIIVPNTFELPEPEVMKNDQKKVKKQYKRPRAVQVRHNDNNKYTCDACYDVFDSEEALQWHVQFHEEISAAIKLAIGLHDKDAGGKINSASSSSIELSNCLEGNNSETGQTEILLTNNTSTRQKQNVGYVTDVLDSKNVHPQKNRNQEQILSNREKLVDKYSLRVKLNIPKKFLSFTVDDKKKNRKRAKSKKQMRDTSNKQNEITLSSLLESSYNPFNKRLKTNNSKATSSNEILVISSDDEDKDNRQQSDYETFVNKYNLCEKLNNPNTSSSLPQNEILSENLRDELNECSECGEMFKDSSSLKHHKVKAKLINHCNYCRYFTCLSLNLKDHCLVEHKMKYFCNFCKLSFITECNFEDHNKLHVCPKCKESCVDVTQHLESCKSDVTEMREDESIFDD